MTMTIIRGKPVIYRARWIEGKQAEKYDRKDVLLHYKRQNLLIAKSVFGTEDAKVDIEEGVHVAFLLSESLFTSIKNLQDWVVKMFEKMNSEGGASVYETAAAFYLRGVFDHALFKLAAAHTSMANNSIKTPYRLDEIEDPDLANAIDNMKKGQMFNVGIKPDTPRMTEEEKEVAFQGISRLVAIVKEPLEVDFYFMRNHLEGLPPREMGKAVACIARVMSRHNQIVKLTRECAENTFRLMGELPPPYPNEITRKNAAPEGSLGSPVSKKRKTGDVNDQMCAMDTSSKGAEVIQDDVEMGSGVEVGASKDVDMRLFNQIWKDPAPPPAVSTTPSVSAPAQPATAPPTVDAPAPTPSAKPAVVITQDFIAPQLRKLKLALDDKRYGDTITIISKMYIPLARRVANAQKDPGAKHTTKHLSDYCRNIIKKVQEAQIQEAIREAYELQKADWEVFQKRLSRTSEVWLAGLDTW